MSRKTKVLPFDHWSASRFACWQVCPAEFYSRYIAGHPEDPTEPMLFGSALHAGLDVHFKGGDGEREFRRVWKEACDVYLLGQASPKLTAIGLELFDCVVELGLEGQSEWEFRLETGLVWGAPTIGFVDLVGKDGRRVFDFKTTTGKWSQTRAMRDAWQPCLYTWAVAEQQEEWPERFTYVVMNKVSRTVELFDIEAPHERWSAMYDAAREISLRVLDGDFACHGQHGPCPECGAVWDHGHVCDLTGLPPRVSVHGEMGVQP